MATDGGAPEITRYDWVDDKSGDLVSLGRKQADIDRDIRGLSIELTILGVWYRPVQHVTLRRDVGSNDSISVGGTTA